MAGSATRPGLALSSPEQAPGAFGSGRTGLEANVLGGKCGKLENVWVVLMIWVVQVFFPDTGLSFR